MFVMQENRELLAQGFVALIVMAGDHRRFEDGVLDILGQPSPAFEYAGAKCAGKSLVHSHVASSGAVPSEAGTRVAAPPPLERGARVHNPPDCEEFLDLRASVCEATFWKQRD
jgi:hypothetical protein